jgi:hypothetical protein
MSGKESPVFVLKRFFLVVLGLVCDVGANIRHIRFANRENSISCLPGKVCEAGVLVFDPFGRGLLDLFDRLTHGYGSSEIEKKMNMVVHGINDQGWTSPILQDFCHISMEVLPNVIGDKGLAVFRAEDQVKV